MPNPVRVVEYYYMLRLLAAILAIIGLPELKMKKKISSKTPLEKALFLNLDPSTYGSLAEIGAGQEVSRYFFHAGGASGTIAMTISAYDMQFSDAHYGREKSGRYVSRPRLERMVEKEFNLVLERVGDSRPKKSRFFGFADTVAASKYKSSIPGHGWMGIKFQDVSGAEPSQIALHTTLLDRSNLEQQSALGTLGVNLIYGAFNYSKDPKKLVLSLLDDLDWGRIEVDYIEFSGPGFKGIDNRDMNLELVLSSLAPVVMFGKDGNAVVPSDYLYKKEPLILRGTFKPLTNIHVDMVKWGTKGFCEENKIDEQSVALFCEMNVAKYISDQKGDVSDLLDRVDMISELGYSVMVTSHFRHFRISEYLSRDRLRKVGFILSVANLCQIFNDSFYEGMEGGILAALGKLLAHAKLYVYPNLNSDHSLVTLENVNIEDQLKNLFRHLTENHHILAIQCSPHVLVPIDEGALLFLISSGDQSWKRAVPKKVAKMIKAKRLFSYKQ